MGNELYVYDKNGTFLKIYYDGKEEEVKKQEREEVFIVQERLLNPIVDEGKLREMTTSEMISEGIIKLTDGQYLKKDEIITIEKPEEFYTWDSKKHKWNYDKHLEIDGLNVELANLESVLLSKYDELDKAIFRKLKTLEKRLNAEIEGLSLLIDEKYTKLEELEG